MTIIVRIFLNLYTLNRGLENPVACVLCSPNVNLVGEQFKEGGEVIQLFDSA
jgi:hypothetical protein